MPPKHCENRLVPVFQVPAEGGEGPAHQVRAARRRHSQRHRLSARARRAHARHQIRHR